MTCCLAQHPADRRRPTCWQIPLSYDAGTILLVAGIVAGTGLELTVTRPMTKATLNRTSMAAVTRRIRRARPVVWTKAGTVLEGTVMVLPFLLLFSSSVSRLDWPARPLFGASIGLCGQYEQARTRFGIRRFTDTRTAAARRILRPTGQARRAENEHFF